MGRCNLEHYFGVENAAQALPRHGKRETKTVLEM